MDLPNSVVISEEGPREGFQIEQGPIATADKIALIDALSNCGLRRIQIASFVNAKHVPGWADAEAVVEGFTARQGVEYSALWFNEGGLRRALAFGGKLSLAGFISLSASEAFAIRNLNRDRAGQIEAMRKYVGVHQEAGVPIAKIIVMAAFGCNFSGDVSPTTVVGTVADGLAVAREFGVEVRDVALADSMGWATPRRVAAAVGAVRDRWPNLRIALHLHDTRGQGIACAYEGLRLGVTAFDAAVAGLGGCPFAGQPGAPGNIATEELALLCDEMGIATGLDIEALIEAGRLAERIVGHRLPSAALRSGTLAAFRKRAA
ncbi:hydroxymethylglutaryl-CoA lyase [Bradyrhizobium sp. AUGA SZCCT0240]|uniref:hydroxymethylglutaryl-CoA lyase n=1 Tax=unclassified Bradyrhizobium TaxID=2631580 RepID=UPI001BA9ADEB|nr:MULTISPECIES: hydroxymethylglutaryl-CoA lyase [unclassified Bradyrhizobium]MBR1197731.1 hydroxymethylglutaryl-CoA lyase [Bradyrhizobium sp. AUGA SZCCT0158]MBR1240149.1 hydroxymethylglutaryl-CoA lyase [Bradyrhizobium sp. AUGA SZCCT0274]MBR1254410.1 hydroxymethylglutaryl-CoA lyase [Bradyrhizobium sp. AUGA SZCCT0240]